MVTFSACWPVIDFTFAVGRRLSDVDPGDRSRVNECLLGAHLLEQQEEWQLDRRRFFSEATMGKIPEPEEPLKLTVGDAADQTVAAIN